jgi:hypothetical protein
MASLAFIQKMLKLRANTVTFSKVHPCVTGWLKWVFKVPELGGVRKRTLIFYDKMYIYPPPTAGQDGIPRRCASCATVGTVSVFV